MDLFRSCNALIYRCQYVFGTIANEICGSRRTPMKYIVWVAVHLHIYEYIRVELGVAHYCLPPIINNFI